MTSGEQSVSAMMPNLRSGISGASLGDATCAFAGTGVEELTGAVVVFEVPQPDNKLETTPAAAVPINVRRVKAEPRGMMKPFPNSC